MKKKIEEMITLLESGGYDEELAHFDYDKLLEEFIENFDASLYGLMLRLISIEKNFWYA